MFIQYFGAEIYKEATDRFNNGRVKFWEELVEKTIKLGKTVVGLVNVKIKSMNGTDHLKMAYEEVLFPVMFAGKKKYYAVPHVDKFNDDFTNLMIKGMEHIKVGRSELIKR